MTGTSIAIALSGGGHRASLFGLGVLLYIANAKASPNVVSIASVSGGSITNGFVAQTLDYSEVDGRSFTEEVAAPLACQIAQRGTLFTPLATKLYIALIVLIGLVTVITPFLLSLAKGWKSLIVIVGVLLFAWFAWQRGKVCAAAYRKVLFSPNGKTTKLGDIHRRVSHLLCATDLRTGRQVYLSPKFVYGFSFGWSPPERVRLSEAVLASACFPGGFPPLRLSTRGMTFRDTKSGEQKASPRSLVLVDGGVYDNMADQWSRGFDDRLKRWPDLAKLEESPDTLIVVNSSARQDWKPFPQQLPIWREISALLRDMDVMYENTTAVRRQDLIDRFDQAQKAGAGLRGSLIMIRQSPFLVPSIFAQDDQRAMWPDRASRADAVLRKLERESKAEWQKIARENSRVPTTLKALGTEVSVRLLRHAYVLAMANLHVILDFPLHDFPPEEFFLALVRGEAPKWRRQAKAT